MQDNQSIDKDQAMKLAAILLSVRADGDNETLADQMLALADVIRRKDQERVRERIGNPKLGC